MLGPERLARYRAMSPAERYEELKVLMDMAWDDLRRMTPEDRTKRLEAWRRGNEQATRAMAETFARLRRE